MRALAPLVALVLAIPLADALPWSPSEITVASTHAGDRLLLRHAVEDAVRVETETVVHVEGPTRARDQFGIERQADAYRVDRYEGGALVAAQRCFGLAGGTQAVRREILHGAPVLSSFGVGIAAPGSNLGFETDVRVDETQRVAFGREACDGANALGGRSFEEGGRATLVDLLPGTFEAGDEIGDILSAPADETTFHGRDALEFRFDVSPLVRAFAPAEADPAGAVGSAQIVVADGLPGIARLFAEYGVFRDGAWETARESTELVGYAPASGGEALAPLTGATLPEDHPMGRFAPRDRLRYDDAAFGFPFTYAEAFDAMRADPALGLSEYLAANPDAFLQQAHYDRGARYPFAPEAPTEGAWNMVWCAPRACFAAQSVRVVVSATPPLKVARNRPLEPEPPELPPAAEDVEVVDSATVLAVLEGLDVGMRAPQTLGYWGGWRDGAPYAGVVVGDFSAKDASQADARGQRVWVDMLRGRAAGVYESRAEFSGGLPLALERPEPLRSDAEAPVAALASPVGLGVAAAALTGIAVLLILLKTFAPLFTRLARDRLLDNPIRAGLYERIRTEPGIHRAELVEFAGIGNGATRHHLGQLVRHRLVYATDENGYVRYFATGEVPPDVARRESLLRAGSHRAVYDLFAARPSTSLREAARELGISAPSVFRAKRRLEQTGLLPAPAQADVGVTK